MREVLSASFDQVFFRRGAIFLINIGAPVLVAATQGELRAALLGAVTGLLLSFADNDGSLWSRFRVLGLTAFGLIAGGLAGYLLRGYPPPFWLVYVAVAFAAGLLNRLGREPHLAARFGAMALAVLAGVPAIELEQIWYLLGVVALAALTRTIDYVLFGNLPRGATGGQTPPTNWTGWVRYAVAYAAVAAIGLGIGVSFGSRRAIWIAVTTLVVMQPDARSNYRRIIERIFGTFVGVLVAWLLIRTLHAPIALSAAILTCAFVLPHHIPHRYWLHTAIVAVLVMLCYDLGDVEPGFEQALLEERMEDVLIGAALALIGTFAAFGWRKIPFDQTRPEPPL